MKDKPKMGDAREYQKIIVKTGKPGASRAEEVELEVGHTVKFYHPNGTMIEVGVYTQDDSFDVRAWETLTIEPRAANRILIRVPR